MSDKLLLTGAFVAAMLLYLLSTNSWLVSWIIPPDDPPPEGCAFLHLDWTAEKGNYWVCDKWDDK